MAGECRYERPAELSLQQDKEALSAQRMRDTHRWRGKERPREKRTLLLGAGRKMSLPQHLQHHPQTLDTHLLALITDRQRDCGGTRTFRIVRLKKRVRDYGSETDCRDTVRQKEESDIFLFLSIRMKHFDEQEKRQNRQTTPGAPLALQRASRLVGNIKEVPLGDADTRARHTSYSKHFCLCVSTAQRLTFSLRRLGPFGRLTGHHEDTGGVLNDV